MLLDSLHPSSPLTNPFALDECVVMSWNPRGAMTWKLDFVYLKKKKKKEEEKEKEKKKEEEKKKKKEADAYEAGTKPFFEYH